MGVFGCLRSGGKTKINNFLVILMFYFQIIATDNNNLKEVHF